MALDLERILIEAGYRVAAIAADKGAALAAAPGCTMAFVDVNLRDGPTGPAIARALSQDFGVKVVFVTANPGQIVDPDGALGYVHKPFSDKAILGAAAVAAGHVAHSDEVMPLARP